MRLTRASLAVAATAAFIGAFASSATAFDVSLTGSQIAEAIAAGQKQTSSKTHGFTVADYVLYDRKKPLYIQPGDGLVDAVIVGTPRERLLYQSYLAAFQGTPMTDADGKDFADRVANSVAFRVFAHAPSSDESDRNFLSRFGEATLTLEDGTKLTARPGEVFGPGQDFFILPKNNLHVFRWLGSLNYSFDLGGLKRKGNDLSSLKGHLAFTDPAQHAYGFDVDLSAYR